MKKNYFYSLFAALMLFVAVPATAQVSSMSDLYGKYKFTAEITTTEAGTEHADKFKNDCEVTIKKAESEHFMAEIVGFAGADLNMSVAGFNAANSTFDVSGPNDANYGIWNGYIAVANEAGEWPFAKYDVEGSEQFGMTFTFNPETKEITVPDFTIVSLNDFKAYTTTVLATVKNVKITLVEAEIKDTSKYPDLTGVWTWEGKLRTDTVDLKGFNVEFTQVGDSKENWNAKFTFGSYEPFELPATFDGSMVTIPHDTIYLDREAGIRFGVSKPGTKFDGSFNFSYNSKTSMSLYDYIYVRKDTINPDTKEIVGGFIHQVFDGYITRENPDARDWSGTYSVRIPDSGYEDQKTTDDVTFPTAFGMTIEKRAGNIFVISEFLGYKNLNISLTPADDDKSATINLGGYSGAMLKDLGNAGEDGADYAYHVITDANGEPTTLTITVNEDGSFSFEDFSVSYKHYASTYDPLASFSGAVAEKKAFDWAGTYLLNSNVVAEDGTSVYPSEFEVVVTYDEKNNKYFVSKFMGTDLYSLNQGSCLLEVAEAGNEATLSLGQYYGTFFVGGKYPDYITMSDSKGAATSLVATLGAGNVISLSDFAINAYNWDNSTTAKLATYSNVTLEKVVVAPKVINPVADKDKDINAIDWIGFNFDEAVAVNSELSNGLAIKNDDVAVANIVRVSPSSDNKIIYFDLDNKVTAPGTYTLEIPAGLITSADGSRKYLGGKFTFTVVAPAPEYYVSPNAYDKLTKIESINIAFNNVKAENGVVYDNTKSVVLITPVSTTPAIGTVTMSADKDGNASIAITFVGEDGKALTFEDPGKYTLTIDAGLFTMNGVNDAAVANEEIKIEYNVEEATPVTPLEVVKVTPEIGAVGEIAEIEIEFNQYVYFGWNGNYAVYLTAEDGTRVALWNNPKTYGISKTVVLSPVELGTEGYPSFNDNGYVNTIKVVAAGKYTLNLADVVVSYGADVVETPEYSYVDHYNAEGSCEGTYTWTVDPTLSIDGVDAEEGEEVIYDLTGRRVNEITNAGIYIINGKKVLVK